MTDQQPLVYPDGSCAFCGSPGARATDPDTSRTAARRATVRAGRSRARLLASYAVDDVFAGNGGLTDEQAAEWAGVHPRSCWWKRCSELRHAGLIADTGERRPGAAGPPRMVCAITDAGRREHHRVNRKDQP